MPHAAVVQCLSLLVGCAAVASAAVSVAAAHPRSPAGVRSPLAAAYPGPGWRVASPRTGITFGGVPVASLDDVRVTGSVTGAHAGDLHELRSGDGAVFVPRERFASGETVTVRTGAAVLGAPDGAFSFTIATDAPPTGRRRDHAGAHRDPPPRPGAVGIGTCPLRRARFHTRPGFRPPAICTTRRATAKTARGRLL